MLLVSKVSKTIIKNTLLFKVILLLLAFSPWINLKAQVTKCAGKVIDETTREPLPFVNVVFQKTTVGTTTDFDGNFSLSTDKPTDSLIISYVGFNTKKVKVNKGSSKLDYVILLGANTTTLKEVVIKPGENPAHRIIKAMIKNKPINDRAKLDYYSYEVYNKIEFDINNIDDKLKNNRLMRPFKFVFDNIDSSNAAEKPSLPMFLSESISEMHYRRSPKVAKEIIKASKVAGVTENKSVSQFTGDLYQNVNLYDNNILVFGKQFVSPLSDNGLFYYRYYLIDSVNIGNYRCYHIQFKPRRKQELTFTGNMWINDTTFAVKRIEMNMAADANINFVKHFFVVQDYTKTSEAWMLEKDRLVVDFILQKNQPGFYGRKTTSYRNFKINQPKEESFYTKTDNLIVDELAEKRDSAYWVENRHDTLSKNEQKIYYLVDTIQTLRAYKTWVDVVQLFYSGYRIMGKFELGPYYNMFSFNQVEGPRLRLGGRTSNAFSKMHELSAYTAYGFLDQEFKYGAAYRGFVTKTPRTMMFARYKNDYEILGQSQNGFTQDNIIASLFRRNPLNNLTRVVTYSAAFSHEWFTGFENKITLINRKLTPIGGINYEYFDLDSVRLFKQNIRTSEIRLYARLAIDEKYLAGEFDRMSTGTKYPIVSTQLTFGIKNVFKSDFTYQKLVVNVQDRFRINPFGFTDYILEYGKIWGRLPYPLLELHGGNETYYYDPYAFNMMNYFEFASDHYFSAAASHHFEGIFLNKIPLMRKLKWREVASGKILWGGVNAENKKALVFPSYLTVLGKTPYAEVALGVENIFRVLRFDAMWRLTYRDQPNVSKFGLRGTLQFIF